ncbi:MAG: lipid-A-disaccharide synthase [Spongiibacteraceae bacterium]|jgi:lipid-A-disaccharide synthase|nr:lipid-A-disaccharide synthase [Spongiibacteraceae bacterium]
MAAAQATASSVNDRPLRIGIVAGEASGDILGADLLTALNKQCESRIEAAGIGGARMLAQGFDSRYDIDRLAVMGFVEPLKRLPELLRMRRDLLEWFTAWQPDVVIGIDSPDFNLDLELKLRERGICTAHYVSPSVWAWRRGRIHKIRRAIDRMLVLFPFEEQFYLDHQVPVTCVGHPLADQFPLQPDTDAARAELGIAADATVVALLPGSRGSEVEQLGGVFLDTAQWLLSRRPGLQFVLPVASSARRQQLEAALANRPALPLKLLDGQSQLAMTAADSVLMASGTTTLEAMLLKKPMVVAYRMGRWTFALLARLVKTDYIALPNLLAQQRLVPECLQEQVCPEVLGPLLLEQLDNDALRTRLTESFTALHQVLRRDAGARAAQALLDLIRVKSAR